MVIMLFKSDAFKTIMLPNLDNTDYKVYIDKDRFHIFEGFYLRFEVIGRRWIIKSDNRFYELYHHKERVDSVEISGDELINVVTRRGEELKLLTRDAQMVFSPYQKYDLFGVDRIDIGKHDSNTISYDFNNLVSKTHCIIFYNSNRYYINDTSSNGVFVNAKRIRGTIALHYGDLIEIFGLRIIYLQEILAIGSVTGDFVVSESLRPYKPEPLDKTLSHLKHRDSFFNRSPRILPNINTDEIVIEAPTNPQVTRKKSMLLTIGPSFTMAIPMMLGCALMIVSARASGGTASAFMFTGMVTAIGSAILGSIWAILNVRDNKRKEYEDETQRFNMYGNYLIEMSEYIKERYRRNSDAMHNMYPSASECCSFSSNNPRLWNRNINHPDFLFYRLGVGNIPFQMKITVPEEKFSVIYDSLKDKPAMLRDNFQTLINVPVGVDFSKSNMYGIVGGNDMRNAYDIVNNIIVQIAATTSYTDVKIAFCFDAKSPADNARWDYIKWLPHIWSENKSIRYYATNRQEAEDVFFELSGIFRQRAESSGSFGEKTNFRPHYFLFVSDPGMLEGELIGKYVYDNQGKYGLTTILMADMYQNLPNSCENIIENDSSFCGFYNVMTDYGEAQSVAFDRIRTEELTAFAKRISGVTVMEMEDDNSLLSTLSFFEMYGAHKLDDFNIVEQWRKNRTFNSMKALIGKKAGGSDCYLDIHEKHHGPHGLVAGTTGSGKSELIQTFMLSLAVNYSPDDIAFFVIDFKGGGMANLFSDLPHMAGQISNLSGNQIGRAMISIKSENLRRQRVFSEYGVNNINLYTQLYKSGKASVPIPHLIIVIDEFAELKKEEPDFMRELISVAQVGRSLGVHLILATQKPSGTVDDNIWSNAKFRLCLRVQDRQDSNDMLHKPDAAYITQAGRCYLQVGNDEIYELFQSGWSGAVYEPDADSSDSDIATMITPTGKTALVGSHTKMKRKELEKQKWYGFLYDVIRELREKEYNHDQSYLGAQFDRRLSEQVAERAQAAGFNIGSSHSELQSISNFASLMPGGTMDREEAVGYITLRALEKNVKLPELKEKTQLEAIVEYICRVAKEENIVQRAQLWMPLLKTEIYLSELIDQNLVFSNNSWPSHESWSMDAVVGLYDDSHNQAQLPFSVDFANGGHLAVCGSVVSGKSTFMQTLVFSLAIKYPPDMVNFYLLDFSSGMLSSLSELPHTGGVVRENELEKASKFFNMISSMIEERKKLLSGGNFSQYIKVHKSGMPAVLIVIDNFASFKEKTDNIYEEILIRLSREGVGYGIFLAVTSAGFGLAEIQNRIGDNIRTVISLEMSDKFKYMDIMRTTHVDVTPESGIKGRGIGYVDGRLLEFQTALSVKADDDYKRNGIITEACEKMRGAWSGKCARRIPSIPENPQYEDIRALDEYAEAVSDVSLVPFAYNYEDASVYSIDLKSTFCYCITGKKRTGKSNVLKLLMTAVSEKKGIKAVIEKDGAKLKGLSGAYGFRYLSTDADILDFFKEITPTFIERNKLKKQMLENGCSDSEIFEKMQRFEPVFVFIADIIEFINSVYHPQDGIGNMSGFFENIFDKGYLHNVFFFGGIDTDEASKVAGIRAYTSFISCKTGVHLGGNVAAQRIFNFQNIHYSKLSKTSKKGEGLVPSYEDETVSKVVIIPLFGGMTS